MIVGQLQHALILVAALCYGEARPLECSQKVGGTGDNTCPRMVEDDNVWQCLSSILNCPDGLVYHCLRNERGEWTEVCAKEEMCEKGKEPMLTNAGNIVCRYCHDPERYNPEKETLSNKLSECPNKKTVCIKEKTDRIECEEPYDKDDPNSKYKMDRQCRCSYEEDMIPKFYVFGRDTWTCSYPEVMKCLHMPCSMTKEGKKQTRGRDYKCYPVETVSPVTSTSAIAFNKSKTTFRATEEDINKKTPRFSDSTTEMLTSLPPYKMITERSDVPHDGFVTHKLIVGCVGALVVIALVSVYCHWYYKKKKHKNENTTTPTVIHNTTNIAEVLIQSKRGNLTLSMDKNNCSDTELPEITPHRSRMLYRPKKDYKRATSDETSTLGEAPLASGEEIDDMDDTDIQPIQEEELHSSVEVDIHEPPSEAFNYHFESKCKDNGKGRADMNSRKNHRHSLSQGTDIFNKQKEVGDHPDKKTRSYPNVAVTVADNRTEQAAETSSRLGENYKRVLAKMTKKLKEGMDPESVLDSLKMHEVGRPNNYMNISDEPYRYKKNDMIIDLIKGYDNYKKFKTILKETNHKELLEQINRTEVTVLSEAGGSGELSEGRDEDEELENSAPFSYRTEEQHNRSLNNEPEDNTDNHLSCSRQYIGHDTVDNKDAEAKQILDSLVEDPWEVLAEKTKQIENNLLKKNLKIPEKAVTCTKHLQLYQKSQSSLPEDLEAFQSSANGDCLYNSVSIILYGDEHAAYRLRLGAVLEGIKNCKKYIKQLITDRSNVQELRLFMQSVLTDHSLNKLDASRSEDLEYLAQFLIQNAVLETIKPGSYSSPIQVLFLANAIGYRIRQYYEHKILPKDDVLPLFGTENVEDCIILLWVKTDGSGKLNHIVPVLPKAKSAPTSME